MIYLDNASTTKVNSKIVKEISKINSDYFYNPSSLHKKAVELSAKISSIEENILNSLGASVFDKMVFTSSATEANNLAIRGALKKHGKLVITNGEHPSVYNLAKQLQNEGYSVEFAKLTKTGTVDLNDLTKKLKNATVLSVIHTSNETGAVNNIKEITKIAKNINPKIIVHSDGVQSVGKINVNLTDFGVDLYTISAHKINGPKGVGALYVRNGITLKPLILGGPQEGGLRGGTENTSGIVALGLAVKLAAKHQLDSTMQTSKLHDLLVSKISSDASHINIVETNKNEHSSHIIVLSLPDIKSETALYMLEEQGILVGNGSACSSRLTNNRVLSEMGYDSKFIESSIRISFGADNKESEILTLVSALKTITKKHKTGNI